MNSYIIGLVEGTVLGALGVIGMLLNAARDDGPPGSQKYRLPWQKQRQRK